MKATVSVSTVGIDVEIECQDTELKKFCEARVLAAAERFEHVISQAVCAELKLLLPGLECRVISIGDDEPEIPE